MSGAIKEVVNHARDYDFEMVFGKVSKDEVFPDEFEIPRNRTGTLKDQEQVLACVAEVIASIAEVLWEDALEEDNLEMSEGFSYVSLRDDSHKGTGLIISQAMKLWCEVGTLPKRYFDKLAEMPEIKKIVDSVPHLYEFAKKHKISGYVPINYASKEKKDLCVKSAFLKLNYGFVACADDYFKGGPHCIQLTGWNDRNGTYKFKNSWGKDYGDEGFSEIPKDEVSGICIPLLDEIVLPFKDVSRDAWYFKYVKNMYFSGLMKGTSEDTFEPDRAMTRAEVATLCYNILKNMDERFDILNKVLEEKK